MDVVVVTGIIGGNTINTKKLSKLDQKRIVMIYLAQIVLWDVLKVHLYSTSVHVSFYELVELTDSTFLDLGCTVFFPVSRATENK